MSSDHRVLITGAGGFIGGRVAEVLHGSGWAQVRAGVRKWACAARIGRPPVTDFRKSADLHNGQGHRFERCMAAT